MSDKDITRIEILVLVLLLCGSFFYIGALGEGGGLWIVNRSLVYTYKTHLQYRQTKNGSENINTITGYHDFFSGEIKALHFCEEDISNSKSCYYSKHFDQGDINIIIESLSFESLQQDYQNRIRVKPVFDSLKIKLPDR